MPDKIIGGNILLPASWRAMFVYRGDDGEVVLHSSPLKFWSFHRGPRSRWFVDGVTEDGSAVGINNPHFCGYLREGEPTEKYRKVAEARLRRLEEAGAPLWPG